MRPRFALIIGPVLALLLAVVLTVGGVGPFAANDTPASASAPAADSDPAVAPSGDASGGGPAPTSTAAAANRAEAEKAAVTEEPADAGAIEVSVGKRALPAVERTLVHLIELQHSTDPASIRKPAALAERSCAALDTSKPLAAALQNTCADTITIAKLTGSIGQRCELPTADCARSATHLADAARRYVRARSKLAKALRAEVAPGVCRKALLPTRAELSGIRGVMLALRHLAKAALAENAIEMTQAGQELQAAALTANTDARPAIAVSEAVRAACQLPRFHEFD